MLATAPPPNPRRVGAVKGTVTHLDEYQAYEKLTENASLRITISGVFLDTIDDNADLAAWECPPEGNCEPVRTVVRSSARLRRVGGRRLLRRRRGRVSAGPSAPWRPGAATSADSPGPLGEEQFDVDGDADDSGTGAEGLMDLRKPRVLNVPLAPSVPASLFAVHVSLEAEAVDDRGGESAAQAVIQTRSTSRQRC